MFIPVGTDAPIYHFPFATLAVAVANVAAHVAFDQLDTAAKIDWCLWFGEGLHPLQWVTSCFLHDGWVHLIGNLIFLWAFGIIVEGKLGWWKFLVLYVGIGAAACAIEQALLLPGWLTEPPRARMVENLREEGASEEQIEEWLSMTEYPDHFVALGASGAIFGLVAICMIWAPKNELSILWLIAFRGGLSDVPILTFCLFYIGFEAVVLGLRAGVLGFEYLVSSAFLHVVGAAVGAGAGVLLLKKDWVDCENWDLFAVLKGTYGSRDAIEMHRTYHAEITVPSQAAGGGGGADGVRSGEDLSEWKRRDSPVRKPRGADGAKRARKPADPLSRLRKYLAARDGISALGEWEALRSARPNLVPPEPDLFALAEAVDKADFADEAAGLFALYLRRYGKPGPSDLAGGEPDPHDPGRTGVIRLRAARRLLESPGRRGDAAALLAGVDPAALTPKQRGMLEKLTARAGS